MTRSWRRHLFLLGLVDLLLIDEIHHLGEDRGATLETVIVRMRILNAAYIRASNKSCSEEELKLKTSVRIIALSATLPNIVDIGVWLGCSQDGIHYFDEGFRPVPLAMHTIAFHPGANTFLFEKSLDEKVPDILHRYSNHQQSLIFCSSKRGTETLASALSERYRCENVSLRSTPEARALLTGITDIKLRTLVGRGLAYHHAGLPPDDRGIVEKLFLMGAIHVLCSTSTLAHGVNLPAHLVVIKGTNCWRGGGRGYEKMARSEVIQMVGRAGRPGFDTEGVAVIMTSTEDKELYEGVSLTADVVESTLPARLIEAICTEVTQSVITSLAEAITWLRSTFFYVRVKRNPRVYGFTEVTDEAHLESLIEDMAIRSVEQLAAAQVVQYDTVNKNIIANPEAHIMSRHIVTFKTMEALLALPRTCSLPALLVSLSQCEELIKPVRRSEKKFLNDSMRHVRFPLKGLVKDSWQKVYVLLQLAASPAFIPDFTLRVEQSEIVEVSMRVLGALQELCVCRLHGSLLESCALTERALRLRVWETNYHSIFYQCTSISDYTRKKLVGKGFVKVEDARDLTARDVQARLTCTVDEAQALLQFTRQCQLARVDVTLAFHQQRKSLDITIAPMVNRTPSVSGLGLLSIPPSNYPSYTVVCYHEPSGVLLCYRHVTLLPVSSQPSHATAQSVPVQLQPQSFTVPITDPTIDFEDVRCVTISSVVGTDNIHKARDRTDTQAASSEKPTRTPRAKTKDTTIDAYYTPGDNPTPLSAAATPSRPADTVNVPSTTLSTSAVMQPRTTTQQAFQTPEAVQGPQGRPSFEAYNCAPDIDVWKQLSESVGTSAPSASAPPSASTQASVPKMQTARATPIESSGSSGNELALARRKGAELRGFQIDCPVKRLRTLSRPLAAINSTNPQSTPAVPSLTHGQHPHSQWQVSPEAVPLNRPLHPEFIVEAPFLAPSSGPWFSPHQLSGYQGSLSHPSAYGNQYNCEGQQPYAQSSSPMQYQYQYQPPLSYNQQKQQQQQYLDPYLNQYQPQQQHQQHAMPPIQYEHKQPSSAPPQPPQYFYQQQSSARAPAAGTFLEETRIRAWTEAPASAAFRSSYPQEPRVNHIEAFPQSHPQSHPQSQFQPRDYQESAFSRHTPSLPSEEISRAQPVQGQCPRVTTRPPPVASGDTACAGKKNATWNIDPSAGKAAVAVPTTPSVTALASQLRFEDAGFF